MKLRVERASRERLRVRELVGEMLLLVLCASSVARLVTRARRVMLMLKDATVVGSLVMHRPIVRIRIWCVSTVVKKAILEASVRSPRRSNLVERCLPCRELRPLVRIHSSEVLVSLITFL